MSRNQKPTHKLLSSEPRDRQTILGTLPTHVDSVDPQWTRKTDTTESTFLVRIRVCLTRKNITTIFSEISWKEFLVGKDEPYPWFFLKRWPCRVSMKDRLWWLVVGPWTSRSVVEWTILRNVIHLRQVKYNLWESSGSRTLQFMVWNMSLQCILYTVNKLVSI